MAYEEELDATIKRVKVTISEHGYLEVNVRCYNGGEKKLEIKRLIKNNEEEWIYVKLKRLTLIEALKVMGAIDKLKEALGWTPEIAEELATKVEEEKKEETKPEEKEKKEEKSLPIGSENDKDIVSIDKIEEIVY